MKIIAAKFTLEANEHVPMFCDLENTALSFGQEALSHMQLGEVTERPDLELIPVLCADAGCSGVMRKGCFDYLEQRILGAIREHLADLDGIYLHLHGASFVEQIGSGEQHLLQQIRKLTGPYLPIAVACDPHGNLTQEYVENTTFIRSYREAPHIDIAETVQRTFQTLIDQIEQFLIELATTNMMADEQGVELTGQEKDSLKTLSKEYYRSLSDQDKDYIDVSESEIYDLYCEYYRADKLVGELTRNENLEVSDAEAKVIQVQQIELDTRERAEDILSQVRQENADFFSIATRSSKDAQILYTMEWNDHLDSRQEAAFALEQDEISGIVEQDGKYYIFKCTNAYDEEATAARKSMLAQDKKTRAFLAIYEPFVREHAVKLKDDLREVVDFSGGQGCVTDSFFQLYHSYFTK